MITIIYAHPYSAHSRIGKALLSSVVDFPHVHIHNLYEKYPDFHIDIKKEQQQLLKSNLIIFQNPMHWYHIPALMSLWLEKVFTYGWSHGTVQKALEGKKFLWVVSTRHKEDFFHTHPEGGRYSIDQLSASLRLTAELCGMQWIEPFVIYNSNQMSEDEVFLTAEKYRDILTRETVLNTGAKA